MGGQVSRDDFEWVYTQEPHADRRKIIIGKRRVLQGITAKVSPNRALTCIYDCVKVASYLYCFAVQAGVEVYLYLSRYFCGLFLHRNDTFSLCQNIYSLAVKFLRYIWTH